MKGAMSAIVLAIVFAFFSSCSDDSTGPENEQVAAPRISPAAGEIPAGTEISIACSTPGAEVHYTLDGDAPTTSSTLYEAPFEAQELGGFIVKAKAFKAGWTASTVASASYTVVASVPVPSMILVGGGTFDNGTSEVTISGFYMGKYEVTQAEFEAVMGFNPSAFPGVATRPVDLITWFDCIEYCNRLSLEAGYTPCYSYDTYGTDPDDWPSGWNSVAADQAKVSCNWAANGYRLPTEMEWMFAAMGGTESHGYTYSGGETIEEVAWYNGNSYALGPSHPDYGPHPVGTKAPNELGLYDMTGNLTERVWDYYAADYPAGPQTDPTGPASGSLRPIRGGSWSSYAMGCTVSYRVGFSPLETYASSGFRVCRRRM